MEGHGGEISLSIVQSEEHEVVLSHSTSSKDSILRIPGLFKMRNEKAYTPYKFSIGPWHFGKTQVLRSGQKLKESFLEKLIDRFPDSAAKKRELEEAIKNVRDEARECYEGGDVYDERENMDVAKEEFEKILLLDGCFIIEVLRTISYPVPLPGTNYQVICHDLLLLDNQIPWFVLKLLFDMTNDGLAFSLVGLAIRFFGPVIPPYDHRQLKLPTSNILHLVDFVWRLLIGTREVKSESHFERGHPARRLSIPSATRLKQAGVQFQKLDSGGILDVRFKFSKFDECVVEIPRLRIDPLTETIFRNLVIFEQCTDCATHMTWYVVLLDCLVETSDDVYIMSRAGILDNRLNPEEMANFFNRVRDNTLINNFCYAQLFYDINGYCDRAWPRWRAYLIQKNYSMPLAFFSTYLAIITLVFTIMQVFSKK